MQAKQEQGCVVNSQLQNTSNPRKRKKPKKIKPTTPTGLRLDVETGGKWDQRKYEHGSCASRKARYRLEDTGSAANQQMWSSEGFWNKAEIHRNIPTDFLIQEMVSL